MKGLHMCIHLKNGKTWSTLRAVPNHHTELMHICDIHLTYFGFGIYLQLIKRPQPIPQYNVEYRKHLKKAASAMAGSQADLPRVEQELWIATTSKQ